MIAKSVVVLISVLLALSLSEFALRLSIHEEQLYETSDDGYWKASLARALDAGHGPAANIETDSMLGWRMKANYRDGDVHQNSHGFRDVREFDARPAGHRILVIGASMVYGIGVDEPHLMTTLLEERSGAQTINAGVNAYGADQALLLWEQEGRPLRPDIVVFVYHVDDFFRNGLTVRDLPKPYFVPDDGGFRLEGVPVPSVESLASSGGLDRPARLRIEQAFAWLYRKAAHKVRGGDPERFERLERLNEYLLGRMHDSVRDSGGRLIVVVTGHCVDGVGDYLANERAISEACRSLDIEFLDLASAMRAGDYGAYFGDNCHWSNAGHAFAAEQIDRALALTR